MPRCTLTSPINGTWNVSAMSFTPTSCHLSDVSVPQLKQCLAHRTIMFLGDSNIRNLGIAFVYHLAGFTPNDIKSALFDYIHPTTIAGQALSLTGYTDHTHNFTIRIVQRNNWEHWNELVDLMHAGHDAMFVELGIHSLVDKWTAKMWSEHPEDFFVHGRRGMKPFLDHHCWAARQGLPQIRLPIWMTFNANCIPKKPAKYRRQGGVVNKLNPHIVRAAHELEFPLLDWSLVFTNTNDTCRMSADGMHLFQWAETVRAQMLASMLCPGGGPGQAHVFRPGAASAPSTFRTDIANCSGCEFPTLWRKAARPDMYANYSMAASAAKASGTSLSEPWCTDLTPFGPDHKQIYGKLSQTDREGCIEILPPCPGSEPHIHNQTRHPARTLHDHVHNQTLQSTFPRWG